MVGVTRLPAPSQPRLPVRSQSESEPCSKGAPFRLQFLLLFRHTPGGRAVAAYLQLLGGTLLLLLLFARTLQSEAEAKGTKNAKDVQNSHLN